VERTREEPGLVLSRIFSVEQAQRELARGLYILLKVGVHRPSQVDSLGPVLQKTPGGCPVFLTVRDPAGKDVVLKLDREYAINPSTYLQEELEAVVGTGGVKLA
jgi:DNA polymerase-3 subunit alpha